MEKNEKKLSILALCNALGSWHYWKQTLTLPTPCIGACSHIACGLGRYPIVQVKTIPKMMWIHEQSLNKHNLVWCQKEIREQGREFPLFSSTKKVGIWHTRVQSDSDRQCQNFVVGVYPRKSHQYHVPRFLKTLNHRLQLTNSGLHSRLNFINSIPWFQSTTNSISWIESLHRFHLHRLHLMNSKPPQTPFHKFHFMNSECHRLFPFHEFKTAQTHHHFMNSEHNRFSSWREREL